MPKTNQEFWIKKLERNRQRDEEVNAKLTEHGWIILRLGEKEIKKDLDKCVTKILCALGINNESQIKNE